MFVIEKIEVEGGSLLGLKADIPEAPPLVLIVGNRGFVMCGYLNIDAAERLGVVAAVVSGVKSFEDVLNAQIRGATSKAKTVGIEPGKVVRTVLRLIA